MYMHITDWNVTQPELLLADHFDEGPGMQQIEWMRDRERER
jgi:hypothetical protein